MLRFPGMMSARVRRGLVALAVVLIHLHGQPAQAFSTGITTLSFASPSLGCNNVGCHSGGQTPTVTLSGPMVVAPGSTNEYTLMIDAIGSQKNGGLNVSALLGTLAVGGADSAGTQVFGGTGGRKEVTHTKAKAAVGGVVTFSFLWTAPTPFTSVTLNAWGNAVNGDAANTGDRAAFTSLTVSAEAAVTPTATPLDPTATPTSTPSPTMGASGCTGDCNGDGAVTVDELLIGVNITLGTLPLDACAAFDANHDTTVTVDELLAAVNLTLSGCP